MSESSGPHPVAPGGAADASSAAAGARGTGADGGRAAGGGEPAAPARGAAAEPEQIAGALLTSVGVLLRRIRQVPVGGGLSMPERQALSRLDRQGPASASELARREQITAQAMGATLATLQARGLIERRPDPNDGRRAVLSVTPAGHQALEDKRNAQTAMLAQALTAHFTAEELARLGAAVPLLERLGESL
jgi:DNA-binding MarR family transcriptional regulator